MKVAVVDVGSNAVRATFYGLDEVKEHRVLLKKLSYLRLPIRLGEDVFVSGKISDVKYEKLLKTAHAFKYLCEIHDIEYFRIVATSAMRDALNSKEIIDHIETETGIRLEVLSGSEEADYIFCSVYHSNVLDHDRNAMMIDVGGGSTEITFLQDGEPHHSRSFQLGTVRSRDNLEETQEWSDFKYWIKQYAVEHKPEYAIGTGGNINRLHKMAELKRSDALEKEILLAQMQVLEQLTYTERMEELNLKADRADVIVPASKIYYTAMECAGLEVIYAPKVGLAEGVARELFVKHHL